MPNANGAATDLKRIAVALAVAAILGVWSFAGTRASSDDIVAVREEIKEVERESKERHASLSESVEEIKDSVQSEAVAAAAFRAQVRSALEIRNESQ
jgi:biopolymer transport protein ExbB/TolQ